MFSEKDLNKIKKMNKITVEIAGLNKAKLVTVRKDRKCFCCNQAINKGCKSVTASHMIDKGKGVLLRDLYAKNSFDTRKYRFIPERHWVCLECAEDFLKENLYNKHKVKEDYFDFELIDLNDYNYDEQLNLIMKAYDYGQLTPEEYDDLERDIIDAIAMEEAIGIGQA